MLVFWRWCFLRGGLPEKVEFIGRDDLIEVGRLFLDVLHVELFEKWLDEFSNIPRHAIPNAKPPMKGDAVNSRRFQIGERTAM